MKYFPLIQLMFLIPLAGTAQNNDEVRVRFSTPFTVTGAGDHRAWDSVEWISLTRLDGPMSYETKVKLLYSREGIYALFSCEDARLTATKTEDFTDLWREDVVEIFFWTDESIPLYFEYELSPLNKELAILVPNFGGNFMGWVPWRYEGVRKTAHAVKFIKSGKKKIEAWTAEVFIPFELLRPLRNVPAEKGTTWRANMYRIDYDGGTASHWAWMPVKTNFHDYKSFGRLVFD